MKTYHSPANSKQITSRQHVFPKSGLVRFVGEDKKLEVLLLASEERQRYSPNAAPFVVNRCWDQRTEAEIMSPIERNFGIVSTRVLRTKITTLDAADHAVVTKMFSLWRVRNYFANKPLPDFTVAGVRPERVLSNNEMDECEHFGIISMRSDGSIPGRMMAGPLLQLKLDQQVASMAGMRWGIINAANGEFLLPDGFGDLMVMPLSPKCCFVADHVDAVAPRSVVAEINSLAKVSAKTYLAARDLSACPGL